MKRVSLLPVSEPCVECGAGADEKCASWCLARVLDDDDADNTVSSLDAYDEFDDETEDETEEASTH